MRAQPANWMLSIYVLATWTPTAPARPVRSGRGCLRDGGSSGSKQSAPRKTLDCQANPAPALPQELVLGLNDVAFRLDYKADVEWVVPQELLLGLNDVAFRLDYKAVVRMGS